ncbi:MAG: hypothetical protein JNK85_00815 [Verrucomicrobiales bacterium]|nr:hypothetical protein [Verrucomicrobiales bacterium]
MSSPVLACFLACLTLPALAAPRLNEMQVIGTHNSYHIAPSPAVDALIRSRDPAAADSLQYTHRPLAEQLERLGIRQIELDLYADPQGGLFAHPASLRLVPGSEPPPPSPDPEVMARPGTKILHVPDFDFHVHHPTLGEALDEVRQWSVKHPSHVPILILLELKKDAAGAEFTQPVPWTLPLLDALEDQVRTGLGDARIFRPDELRGTRRTLRDAIQAQGWPSLAELRGRFLVALDNTDEIRDLYLSRNSNLADRWFFVSVDESHPAAAWFKVNDPMGSFDQIQHLVKSGYLVRTRADADTRNARWNDTRQRDAAFASGAQFISTDYPEPNRSWSSYTVRWTSNRVARPNPVAAPAIPDTLDLEILALPGLEPFPDRELELLNQRAFQLHTQRRLGEASADYARLLELAPATDPTPAEIDLILRQAPVLLTHPEEPFPLRDVVAILSPDRTTIAFHLFWEDDIDFPEDNDPTDHEILWVTLADGPARAPTVATYFHGRLLSAPTSGTPTMIGVEWGKHGSLPMTAQGLVTEPPSLQNHWRTLHDKGIRLPLHPLARRWPKRFEGDWNEYRRFERRVETRPFLESRRLLWVGRWANAILDQHALPYNFAAKTEWPN